MREIKFRAWGHFGSGKGDKMIENWQSSDYLEYIGFDGGGDFVIMQYTGLKDKNGREIYEGDICRAVKSFICSISIDLYDGVMATWVSENARSKLIGSRKERIWRNHEITIEVIGNIYENPELLKL